MTTRTIAMVTVGRSDWGIYRPVARAICNDPDLRLRIVATGGHLVPAMGRTIDEIRADGFSVDEQIDCLLSADTPLAVAKSMGLATMGLAEAYQRLAPDVVLVLGDRFEMHAAALAAVPLRLPLAHIHGGEITLGATDDVFRHAITKYSHLHFAATEEFAARIVQMGEAPWRVTVSGAPALDNLAELELLSRDSLERRLGLPLARPPLLATFHPVTLQYEQTPSQIEEFLAALAEFDLPIVITRPNADAGNQAIVRRLAQFADERPHTVVVENLGTQAYFSLMSMAAALVGNSSSGIIEAASFALPVVNVGIRQEGRPRSKNILDVGDDRRAISAALRRALTPEFRKSLHGMKNTYGSGDAAARIVRRLKSVDLDDTLLIKRFHQSAATDACSRMAG